MEQRDAISHVVHYYLHHRFIATNNDCFWKTSVLFSPGACIILKIRMSLFGEISLGVFPLYESDHESDHWTNRSSEGSVPTFVCPYSICSPRPFEPKGEPARTRFTVVTVNRMVGPPACFAPDGWNLCRGSACGFRTKLDSLG